MCIICVSVDDKTRHPHLSEFFSPLHYSVLHFYVTSSSLVKVKSFRVDKSWKLQAETKNFQLPLLPSSKHVRSPVLVLLLLPFRYEKMYIKGLSADSQWLGEHKELSEGIQKEEIRSSVLSHGRCFPWSGVFACICPCGGFRSLHGVHRLAEVLSLFEFPPGTDFLFLYLPALTGR